MFDEQDFVPEQWGKLALARCKSVGMGVITHHMVQMIKPEMIEIGDCTRIENFVFMNGGSGMRIGKRNHFSWFMSIIGGGELITGDFVSFGAGVRIVNGTDYYGDGKIISPLVPMEYRGVYRCRIEVQKHGFVGTNVVLQPSKQNPEIIIGEGAIIGSCSLVTRSVEPWTINVGVPCRKVGERPRVTREP